MTWIELFNGRDLAGWKANVHPQSFTVVDGTIRAHCTSPRDRAHLFYVGDGDAPLAFRDFELEAVVRGEPSANSGIFFHTDMSTRDDRLHLAKGYEVQLNNAPSEKRKTGSLYAVVDLPTSAVADETQWFPVQIRVEGKRIQVSVAGQQVVNYLEPESPQRPPERKGRLLDPRGGAIALQAHDPQSVYFFKELRLRTLG